MNFSFVCLILFVGLTSQGCLARFKHYDRSEYKPSRSKLVGSEELEQFSQAAAKITNEQLEKVLKETNAMNAKSFYYTKKLFLALRNATIRLNDELMTNYTKLEASSKDNMYKSSKSTSSFFNVLISSVKDRYIKELIGEANRLNGNLEFKAASLRQSIEQKVSQINANLTMVLKEAYQSEAAKYWGQIEETEIAKIISEAQKGVEAQVSAFMAQQFEDNLQNYEAKLKKMQESYIDETNWKISDLEVKKDMYARELEELADSLKSSLQAAKDY
ncbi:hypothetical protein KQX54_003011 [Cotesia glomerata]|uniref:Uncharacterized protein n=1 Tax=Cotesia glomerata TaxID=32391 RepID=A0AAV7IAU3_COTGL|nr:hypothetical protein KQX54_003011 [Cotesia glomerata]